MENIWKIFSKTFPSAFPSLSTLSKAFFIHLSPYCNAALGVTGFTKHCSTTTGAAV